MELSDVVLALVSIISTGLLALMKSTNKTIKDMETRITTCQWESPVAHPDDDNMYTWDEATISWKEIV